MKEHKPLILLTNDDGIDSPGIIALEKSLKNDCNLLIIAPAYEQSAKSHSITLKTPLRLKEIRKNKYAVDGTPVDCINFAIKKFHTKRKIDLVISGINYGANLGSDIFYSGTVAAALEAGNFGLPAFAISQVLSSKEMNYSRAGNFAKKLVHKMLSDFDGEKNLNKFERTKSILNVNIPSEKINGIKFTSLGQTLYTRDILEKKDPWGDRYYWIAGTHKGYIDIKKSDCNAIHDNFISISPIATDITNYEYLNKIKKWKLN